MKVCSKCKIEKVSTDFYKDSKKKDGLKSCCKVCSEKNKIIYRQSNIDKVKESSKKTSKKYYEKNSDIILLRNTLWCKNNSEICKKNKKRSDIKFHSNNPNYNRDYRKNKRNSNYLYRLTVNVRSRLNGYFRINNFNKKNSTLKIIGCTPQELKIYLENKFTDGMSWENQGKWHIDHIIPLSSAKTEEEVYKLCHFTNLQPMWALDNIKKGSKIL
jgi:hypothetical protein